MKYFLFLYKMETETVPQEIPEVPQENRQAPEETIKQKKPRTQKQIDALAKARQISYDRSQQKKAATGTPPHEVRELVTKVIAVPHEVIREVIKEVLPEIQTVIPEVPKIPEVVRKSKLELVNGFYTLRTSQPN
jgi:hypothetical protein